MLIQHFDSFWGSKKGMLSNCIRRSQGLENDCLKGKIIGLFAFKMRRQDVDEVK